MTRVLECSSSRVLKSGYFRCLELCKTLQKCQKKYPMCKPLCRRFMHKQRCLHVKLLVGQCFIYTPRGVYPLQRPRHPSKRPFAWCKGTFRCMMHPSNRVHHARIEYFYVSNVYRQYMKFISTSYLTSELTVVRRMNIMFCSHMSCVLFHLSAMLTIYLFIYYLFICSNRHNTHSSETMI